MSADKSSNGQHGKTQADTPGGKVRKILITGGAGFIGSNLAERVLADPSARVRIFDNLSRTGVAHNLAWLQGRGRGKRLEFVHGDITDAAAVRNAVQDADEIYHLAAQVAVTTSVDQPRLDFDINVCGTLNVLEAARCSGRLPFLLFTSTNKVYGSLPGVPVVTKDTRYAARDIDFRGVMENEPLDFHSPYGCSKGAADQYVRDYARIYNLPTVVFRMSCIAGPRQFGTEDQGWVAHFLYSVLEGKPITIYGDGFQVRDVLHVSDLVDAMQKVRMSDRSAGEIYNLGGGPERAISVVEMLQAIARQTGIRPILHYKDVRPGDQPLYISNTAKLAAHTGWRPHFSIIDILQSIHGFWRNNRAFLAEQRKKVGPDSAREMVVEEVA
ncbi:MAG TPA: GDP-mannose 4,6-dehydratase [Acidobacteriaceae bacterium]|nr:GDP-mannose 4,6-dehydratase [Acidobacteriaceae bacterium]